MLANPDYEEITRGLTTKSDKIRTLARRGVPTAEIARFLGIRYQHARNVLADAGLKAGTKVESPHDHETRTAPQESMAGPAERKSFWSNFSADGGLTIPEDLLRRAGFVAGDRVFVGVTDDGLELLPRKSTLKRLHAIADRYKEPGDSAVEEFIATRRKAWGEE